MSDKPIYIGDFLKPEPKKQLLTKNPASPVFVSKYDLAGYDGPDTEKETTGRVTFRGLYGEPVKGYRCKNVKAFYQWAPNGPNKGFSQTLICHFSGSEPEFNHMMRFLQNRHPEFFVFLPRENKPYVVVGNDDCEIEVVTHSTENQTFILENAYNYVPFPYYDGELQVIDCTEYELIEVLYIK